MEINIFYLLFYKLLIFSSKMQSEGVLHSYFQGLKSIGSMGMALPGRNLTARNKEAGLKTGLTAQQVKGHSNGKGSIFRQLHQAA